jgi:dephospho-CoA kinase
MLKVGLTGSIAVGKSFVTSVLGELGAQVMDADQTARAVVEPGTPGLAEVIETFGPQVLQPDGRLDRAKLGEIVFHDEAKRQRLNQIVHPLVMAAQDEQLRRWEEADPQGVAVVDAALMIESGGYRRFDKLVVVFCRPEIQLARLMRRNGLSEDEARQRIAAQMPQEEKKGYADYLLDTSNDFDDTRRQVEKLYAELRELSRS